jgi:hypothetical protein
VNVEQSAKIINAVPSGWRLFAVAVPTRAIRLIVEDLGLKFRVQQLNPIDWSWRTVSTHVGDEAYESVPEAIDDMITKQSRLREKIKLAQHEKRMAMIKAENPI